LRDGAYLQYYLVVVLRIRRHQIIREPHVSKAMVTLTAKRMDSCTGLKVSYMCRGFLHIWCTYYHLWNAVCSNKALLQTPAHNHRITMATVVFGPPLPIANTDNNGTVWTEHLKIVEKRFIWRTVLNAQNRNSKAREWRSRPDGRRRRCHAGLEVLQERPVSGIKYRHWLPMEQCGKISSCELTDTFHFQSAQQYTQCSLDVGFTES
jgi:hypothetical protein